MLISTILFSLTTVIAVPSVVITSPELAEITALFGTDFIKGVTVECNYPPSLHKVEKVGKFGEIKVETLLALNPDIVLVSAMEQDYLHSKLKKLGIKTHQIYPQSIADISRVIFEIGEILKMQDRAEKINSEYKSALNSLKIEEKTHERRIYIEIYNEPIMTASNSSFVGDVIEFSGAENMFPKLPREYCKVNPESVIEKNPEIILITYPGITASDIKARYGWSDINAIKNNRIYTTEDIDPDLILRAGPRIIKGIRKLRALYNEK